MHTARRLVIYAVKFGNPFLFMIDSPMIERAELLVQKRRLSSFCVASFSYKRLGRSRGCFVIGLLTRMKALISTN